MIEILSQYWEFLLQGFWFTLKASVYASILSLGIGTLIAVVRAYGGRLASTLLGIPVDVFRTIPLLILLVWVFYALPVLGIGHLSPMVAGVISLTLLYSAGVEESVRGGLKSIDRGQFDACTTLALGPVRTVVSVVLPQATIRMMPPLTSQLVSLIKNSSLLYVIALPELMYKATTLNAQIAQPLAIFTILGLAYFVLTYPITIVSETVYRRVYKRAAA